MIRDYWEILGSGKDSIQAIEEDHREYRRPTKTYMMQLHEDREAYRAERQLARQRGDMVTARSLNARIGNCTAKMNKLIQNSLDESIRQGKIAKKS